MGLITVAGAIIPTTAAEAYVVPVGLRTNRINLKFISLDSVFQSVRVWMVPDGAARGDEHLVIGMESAANMLASGEARTYPMNQVLSEGDKIYWEADDDTTDHQIVGKLDVSEVQVAGHTIDGFTRTNGHNTANTDYMPDTLTLAYTVPSGPPAAQLLFAELLVHNDSASDQAFTVSAVPLGGSSGDLENIISSNTQQWHLRPGETRTEPLEHFLTAGYGIYWRSLNTDVIIARLSVEEVRF